MATKQWSGTGDWFSTSWLDITAAPTQSGPPQSGDIAYMFDGTLSTTAAEAVQHPTIDGVTLRFASTSAAAVPTLDVTDIQFGAGMVIDNQVNDNSALVVARGTVGLAGFMEAGALDSALLSLDIEAASGLATFSNSGTVEADNTGSLSVTGTANATLDNTGLLLASDGSAEIATAVVSTGTIGATQIGALAFSGPVTNHGTMFAGQSLGGNLFAIGEILLAGALINTGSISAVTFGTFEASGGVSNAAGGSIGNDGGSMTLGGGVTNSGTITAVSGTLSLAGGLTNTGQLLDQSGTIAIAGGVAGTGTIAVADEVDIAGTVAVGQVVSFTSNDAMLRLADAGGFHGRITDMTGHDLIDLQGVVADRTTYDSGTGTLTVFDGAATVASFQIAGPTGNLGVASDNNDGTILTLEQGGTATQVTDYMIANSAVGGRGNDIIVTNRGNDTIDGGGGSNTVDFAGDLAQYALGRNDAGISVAGLGATDLLTNVATLDFADRSVAASDVSCFVRGTHIATPRGPVAVEDLAAGDDVLTRDGRAASVRWVGQREVDVARHPRPWDVQPVRVRAGAIAPGVPARDLLLSPDHALALQGALVPTRYLLNGATILPETQAARVLYLHVELDRHDILLAEGMPAESYLDTGNRDSFAGSMVTRLHARFAPDPEDALRIWRDRACAPLLVGGEALALLRWDLIRRAETLGHVRTEDPRLRLFADGGPLATRRKGDWLTARLPHGITEVRVSSRVWVPLHMLPEPDGDARRLGVVVAELRLDNAPVPLDDRRLASGWHVPEPHGRWTDGAATIATGGAATLGLRLAPGGLYWRGRARPAASA